MCERMDWTYAVFLRSLFCFIPNLQGIDLIAGGRIKNKSRTAPTSDNVYLALLVKVRWSFFFYFKEGKLLGASRDVAGCLAPCAVAWSTFA